jgi:hypothetical protein
MTVTNPSEQPTLLASLVHRDHLRMLGLLDEAAVCTSTPGVQRDLTRQVIEAVTAHTYAEIAVVHPAARELLGAAAEERLLDDNVHLRHLVLEAPTDPNGREVWLENLRRLVEDHCAALDDDVLPAMATHSPSQMASLGYRFAAVLEGAPRRPAP